MALIYNSKDEETVAKYLKEIEKEENVDKVLGYGNTINENNDTISIVGDNNDIKKSQSSYP